MTLAAEIYQKVQYVRVFCLHIIGIIFCELSMRGVNTHDKEEEAEESHRDEEHHTRRARGGGLRATMVASRRLHVALVAAWMPNKLCSCE